MWQPIETMPVEVKCLVWDGEAIYVAERPFENESVYVEPMRGRFIHDESVIGYVDGPPSPPLIQWMPLPVPPS